VEIISPEFSLSHGGRMRGVLREAGREEPVFLRILRARPWKEPMLEIGIYGENGGAEVGRLILASTEALLLYHAASRDAALAQGRMIPNQLASIARGDEDPGARLAILLEPGMPGPAAGSRSLPELEAEQGAGLVALAEVLGAWDPLRRNRFPLAGDGRPVLPFFSPAAPGLDWDQLRSNPLEVFLPPAIADHIAREPGYRERIYENLFELSARLPELQSSISSLARSRALRPFGPDVSRLEEILEANFAAFRGYLDSVWVEQLVTLTSPTEAALALYLHSVVPVLLNGFHAALARRHMVLSGSRPSAWTSRSRGLIPPSWHGSWSSSSRGSRTP
jgi:hypothetical protein